MISTSILSRISEFVKTLLVKIVLQLQWERCDFGLKTVLVIVNLLHKYKKPSPYGCPRQADRGSAAPSCAGMSGASAGSLIRVGIASVVPVRLARISGPAVTMMTRCEFWTRPGPGFPQLAAKRLGLIHYDILGSDAIRTSRLFDHVSHLSFSARRRLRAGLVGGQERVADVLSEPDVQSHFFTSWSVYNRFGSGDIR